MEEALREARTLYYPTAQVALQGGAPGGSPREVAHAPTALQARGENRACAEPRRGGKKMERRDDWQVEGALATEELSWPRGACAERPKGWGSSAGSASRAPCRAPRDGKAREGRGGGGGVEGGRGEGSRSEGGLIDPAILVKIFKMADGGAASQDESSAAAAAAAGNHYGILHIHIHTRARLPRPPRDLA